MKTTLVTFALVLHLLLLRLADGNDHHVDGALEPGSHGSYAQDDGSGALSRHKRGLGRKIKKGVRKVGRGLKKGVEKVGKVLKKLPLNVEFGGMNGKNSG